MDPWADSSSSWNTDGSVKPGRTDPTSNSPSHFNEGPVDPWAEPSSSSAAASSIPVLPSPQPDQGKEDDLQRRHRSGSGGEFDPWGGNSAPIAPLSTAYTRTQPEEETREEESEDEHAGWSAENNPSFATEPRQDSIAANFSNSNAEESPQGIPDEDDPWGSSAVAKRVKAQQDAEAATHRLEILRLQEEAKGRRIDEEGKVVEEPQKEEVKTEGNKDNDTTSAPVASGWRSLFNRGTSKPTTETNDDKKLPNLETDIVRKSIESSTRPSSANVSAPRLWQAPSLLGGHNRSTSSTSRSSETKEQSTPGAAATAQGPGWEVTTKKQPQQQQGGLIQSLFNAASARTSGENEGKTTTMTRKEEKTSGINRFGRGLQPPPIVSAADDEDDSFDTEETGIEWESGPAFDDAKPKQGMQTDLLSDDVTPKQTESTVGRLLGRWRGGGNTETSKTLESMSKDDLSWLEGVGTTNKSIEAAKTASTDDDWLAFMNQQSVKKTATTLPAHQGTSSLSRSSSDKYSISSTSRGAANVKIPPLAPPPPPISHATPSPFAFRGPGQGVATVAATAGSSSYNTRVTSGASAKTANSLDSFGDFEQSSLADTSPNPNEAYRDDVMDNNAALLRGQSTRLGQTQRSGSFLKGFHRNKPRSRYEYDEDDVDAQDDSWSAFRDEPPAFNSRQEQHRDSRRIASPPTDDRQGRIGPASNVSPSPPPPAAAPSSRPQSGHRSALLPPPTAPQSVSMNKQTSQSLAPSKPASLSKGTTLTNDDLSFFESL